MLTLDVPEFAVEFTDGSIKNVGATNKRATVKLFDVADETVREYGSDRLKLVFVDEAGDEVQVALTPDRADAVADGIAALRASDGDSG